MLVESDGGNWNQSKKFHILWRTVLWIISRCYVLKRVTVQIQFYILLSIIFRPLDKCARLTCEAQEKNVHSDFKSTFAVFVYYTKFGVGGLLEWGGLL